MILLVDGGEVAALRRRVGTVAWCALEVLVTRDRVNADGFVVEASVRVVAGELAVATNTAQRALKTLRSAGVIEPAQARGAGGRFGATTYRLHLPFEIQHAMRTSPQPSRRPRRPSKAAGARVCEQLVLVPSA
jgi:hypothetical protein